MGQLIYAFLYTVDPKSQGRARSIPTGCSGGTLDMSQPEVVEFMKRPTRRVRRALGRLRVAQRQLLHLPAQRRRHAAARARTGLREVIRGFLDKHPDCAFQAVNGGGNNGGYDYARYASTVSFSDGAVGIIRNY